MIYKFNIEDFETKSEDMAEKLDNGDIIIVNGFTTVGIIEASSNGFDYGAYNQHCRWDDTSESFDDEYLIDGGICGLGDALDAITHFSEMMNECEGKA